MLEFVSRYVDERVRAKGSSRKQDIGIYMWRQQALDALQTAVQDAPMDTTTIPIFDEPRLLRTESVPEFKWPGVIAEGKRCHWSSVPCHTDLEADFSRFLDSAKDVVKYVKNERLGFSITYYENNRPRQYFPDFAVELKDGSWWLVETKGEIRPNTAIKKEAAELWCDRMTRAGQGTWRHLFVQEKAFKKARAAGVSSFGALADRLLAGDAPSRRILELIAVDDPRVATERFKTLLPVYSLEAAAGYFGEGKPVELEGWMEVTGSKKLTEDMFVARAVGRSMEPRIQDGDYLVFRAHPKGTRQGKIVLASGPITDPELGGSYTVKVYSSEKSVDPDTGWRHQRIRLLPLNPEFDPIEVPEDEAGLEGFRIVAECLGSASGNR